MTIRNWLIRQSVSDRRSGSLASKLRYRRWRLIQALLDLKGTESVLDVGGTDVSWWFVDWKGPVVRCNLEFATPHSGLRVRGNGCDLPFPDKSFDIAFSNSVIEHLSTFDAQQKFGEELRRVGRRFFVQTPNRRFPIEPHYLFPFFQFLPVVIQRWLHRHFDVGTFKRTDPFGTIRLLTKHEIEDLFPGARLVPERLGPFVKSWYALSAEPPPSRNLVQR